MGQAYPLCLHEILESIVEQFAPDARKGGLELMSFIAEEVPFSLLGDPIKLWQILANFVSNAIRFSERGEIVLCADLEAETDSHITVRFMVTDAGIGIPEEMRPAIFQFQPFSQLGSSIQYGGFGLGLATCKRLAEFMGGEIGFESALGKGSTFWCKVPLEKQAQVNLPPWANADFSGVRVLIADHSSTQRKILQTKLASWKMLVESVASGPEALAALQRKASAGEPYDLTILDMQLSGQDGFNLVERMKDDSSLSPVQLVLVSSGPELIKVPVHATSIAACLVRPITYAALFGGLTAALRKKKVPVSERTVPSLITTSSEPEVPMPPQYSEPPPPNVVKTRLTEPSSEEMPLPDAVRARLTEPSSEEMPLPDAVRARPSTARLPRFSVLAVSSEQVYCTKVMVDIYKMGYEVDAATDCQQAVEALSRFPHGLVLMDSCFSENDIFAAVSEIRRREKGKPSTPILLMLENERQIDRARFLEAGLNDVIDKPIRPETLAGVLAKWDVPIDPGTLAILRGLGHEAMKDNTLKTFHDQGPRILGKMREAVKGKNVQALKKQAELLGRISDSIGAKGIRALCFRVEASGDSWVDGEKKPLLNALEEEFLRAQTMLWEQLPPMKEDSPKEQETVVPKSLSKPGEIKILLCDDDVLQTSLLAHFLERLQYLVLTANDGAEGLALVRKEKPDLLILDMGMPVKTGMEVLEELSKDKDRESLPYIIILSNYESAHIVLQAQSLGADEILTKPINPAALRKKIQELIRQGKI